MTTQAFLVDRVQRGLGAAARRVGAPHDAFRPRTASAPLAISNRFLTLSAAFDVADGGFRRAPGYAQVFWQGIFDAAYTNPGDYLSGPDGVFFVAWQAPLLPVVCVMANRTVTISRPAKHALAGVNSYGGLLRSSADLLLGCWPVSLLMAGARSGHGEVGLPGDGANGTFRMLMPPLPVGAPMPVAADLVADDLGLAYVVSSVEQSAFGWRLTLRQANS